MALQRPKWAEDYIKQIDNQKKRDQITIVPGVLGGVKEPVYTGAGADGKVQPDMPVMQDMTQFHEGEIAIPKKQVDDMGGPNQAMMKIRQMEMRKMGGAPSVTGYMGGGAVGKQAKMKKMANMPMMTGYQEGGVVGTQKDPLDPSLVQRQSDIPVITPENVPTQQQAALQTIPTQQQAAASPISVTRQSDVIGRQGAPREGEAPASTAFQMAPTTFVNGVPQVPTVSRQSDVIGSQGGDRSAGGTATQMAPVTFKGGVQQATVTPSDQIGKPAVPTVTPVGGETAKYDRVANQMLQQITQMATGSSDVFKRQAAAAFGNLDARLQTNLLSTAMRIANNPNLSEGAKTTMMAEEMRNAGIAQSELAGSLASTAMGLAMQATGQAYDMAGAERANVQGLESATFARKQAALSDMATAKDYDGYAKLYQEMYGKPLNIDAMKASGQMEGFVAADTFLNESYKSGAPVTLATPGIRKNLETIWNLDNPGVPMTDEWAADQLAIRAKTFDPKWQFTNGIDEGDALGWFGGDSARLAGFTFGNFKPGLESFQNAMYAFQQGGAFTVNDKGQFDFNDKAPLYQEFLKTFCLDAGTTGAATGTTTTGTTTPTTTPVADVTKTPTESMTDTVWSGMTPEQQASWLKTRAIPDTGLYVDKYGDKAVYVDKIAVENDGAAVKASTESPTGYADENGIPVKIDKVAGTATPAYDREDYKSTPVADYLDWKKYAIEANGQMNITDAKALEYFMSNGNEDAAKDWVNLANNSLTGADLTTVYKNLTPQQKTIILPYLNKIPSVSDGIPKTEDAIPANNVNVGSVVSYNGIAYIVEANSHDSAVNKKAGSLPPGTVLYEPLSLKPLSGGPAIASAVYTIIP
jgi:hypothetical protein